MAFDIEKYVLIAVYLKVKAVAPVYSCLPDPFSLVKFLRMERRVLNVIQEIESLLTKFSLDFRQQICKFFSEVRGVVKAHAFFASAVLSMNV